MQAASDGLHKGLHGGSRPSQSLKFFKKFR
jgi:hypothetical protein